jgi:hypothetical protein
MSQPDIVVGNIVLHPMKPEWGPGKVLVLDARNVVVFFRDIQEDRDGPATKKFLVSKQQFVLAKAQLDPVLDGVGWDAAKGGPAGGHKKAVGAKRAAPKTTTVSVWSQSRAIEEFMKTFPLGFDDPIQHKEERDYKWKAHELYQASLGGGQARQLYDQNDIRTVVERLMRVEADTNLLFANETMALYDGLKDESAAYGFVAALLDLLESREPEESRFHALVTAVRNLPAEKGKSDHEKWPLVTVFPFLAEPDRFMFLKPDATKLAADRLYFNLEYDTLPNWTTFSRLHEMSLQLLEELRPYGAKDLMDVQTFIYVTGRLEAKKNGLGAKENDK